jgi:hypothetical protein
MPLENQIVKSEVEFGFYTDFFRRQRKKQGSSGFPAFGF